MKHAKVYRVSFADFKYVIYFRRKPYCFDQNCSGKVQILAVASIVCFSEVSYPQIKLNVIVQLPKGYEMIHISKQIRTDSVERYGEYRTKSLKTAGFGRYIEKNTGLPAFSP
jgi:hypothetical protein